MNRFAELLDRLPHRPGRNNKLRLMTDYFRSTPDPERGWALAALTGALSFQYAKPNVLRTLIEQRTDPVLFGLSRDYVGDTSETIALMWPADPSKRPNFIPSLTDVVTTLTTLGKAELPAQLARWLDALDETGRWALLKLVTGALRIGVSARLAKTAPAERRGGGLDRIEEVWHGLAPPYPELFAWLEGSAPPPDIAELPTFCPLMLAQPLEEGDLGALDPKDYLAEWKWDGIRVQLVSRGGQRRLYSRSGDDIGGAFPDIVAAMPDDVTLDGELLVMRGGEVAPFNQLQQRLNRKSPDQKMLRDYPAGVRLYD